MPTDNLQSLNWDAVELETVNPHMQRRIVTGNHCFGCTAGSGSSCGGALV